MQNFHIFQFCVWNEDVQNLCIQMKLVFEDNVVIKELIDPKIKNSKQFMISFGKTELFYAAIKCLI